MMGENRRRVTFRKGREFEVLLTSEELQTVKVDGEWKVNVSYEISSVVGSSDVASE